MVLFAAFKTSSQQRAFGNQPATRVLSVLRVFSGRNYIALYHGNNPPKLTKIRVVTTFTYDFQNEVSVRLSTTDLPATTQTTNSNSNSNKTTSTFSKTSNQQPATNTKHKL